MIALQNYNSEGASGNGEMKSFYDPSMVAQRLLGDMKRESVLGRKILRVLGWQPSFLNECFVLFLRCQGVRGLARGLIRNCLFQIARKISHLLPCPEAGWRRHHVKILSALFVFIFPAGFHRNDENVNHRGIHQCLFQSWWCLVFTHSQEQGETGRKPNWEGEIKEQSPQRWL